VVLIRDILIEALTGCGWEPLDPPPGADARLTFGRSEGRVHIDHCPAQRELRLTLDGESDGERRVLALPYGDAIDVVVDKVVAMQTQLSFERCDENLRELAKVCEAFIVDEERPRKFYSMGLQLDDAFRAQLDALARQGRN
jgi:hypothetical protein